MAGKQGKSKSGWVAVLAQLRNPILTFFGLSLLVTESAFATIMWRHSYSEKTIIIVVSLMAGLLALSVLSVLFLAYKAPQYVLLQETYASAMEKLEDKRKTELEAAREHFRRAREAVALVLEYAHGGKKDVASLFKVLSQVEELLTPPPGPPK